MDIQWFQFALGAGVFLLAIVTALVGVGWRMRGMEARLEDKVQDGVVEAMKDHWRAEHTRDGEGRTLRERIGLLEATCKQRHQTGG